MPLLRICTNQTLESDARRNVLASASRAVAELLGKPERYVMIELRDGAELLFAGSAEPACYLELKSIGLPETRTAALSSALADWAEQWLEVPRDRLYIEFADAPRHLWGWNGGTF